MWTPAALLLFAFGVQCFRRALEFKSLGNMVHPPVSATSTNNLSLGCAKPYTQHKRSECDGLLLSWVKNACGAKTDYEPEFTNLAEFSTLQRAFQTLSDIQKQKVHDNCKRDIVLNVLSDKSPGGASLINIADCYMEDPCYAEPRGPSQMLLPEFPGFVYLKYEDWKTGLWDAFQTGNDKRAILIIPIDGGFGGDAGNKELGFDPELGQLPKMFFKSELWVAMHLLHHFREESFLGIAFINPRVQGIVDQQVAEIVNPKPLNELAFNELCNGHCRLMLAFDIAYSGNQMFKEANRMFMRNCSESVDPNNIVRSQKNRDMQEEEEQANRFNIPCGMPAGSLEQLTDPLDKIVLVGAWHQKGSEDYLARTLPYTVRPGKVVENVGYDKVTNFMTGQPTFLPRLIPQFKIPDKVSIAEGFHDIVTCALCCCDWETVRAPYKLYKNFEGEKEVRCTLSQKDILERTPLDGKPCGCKKNFGGDKCASIFPE